MIIYSDSGEILPYSLDNSFIDISVDISSMMSKEHKITALIICIGLCISFTKYGTKIRLSVFGERNNVWLLSRDFTDDTDDYHYKGENIFYQLSRLRDALSCSERIQSFPADALIYLKYNFENYKKNKKLKECKLLPSIDLKFNFSSSY